MSEAEPLEGVGKIIFRKAYRLPDDPKDKPRVGAALSRDLLPDGCDCRLARAPSRRPDLDTLAALPPGDDDPRSG